MHRSVVLLFLVTLPAAAALPIEVDILPGEPENLVDAATPIALPVAIIGGGTLPVASIDPATIRLGRAPLMKHADGALARIADVNGDGRADLLVQVDRRALDLDRARDLQLTARTRDGIELSGSDRVVPLAVELRERRARLRPPDPRGKLSVEPVRIDIVPGDERNRVDVAEARTVPVAIFSAPGFDATGLEPAAIFLAGAPVTLQPGGRLASVSDVDRDGLPDLVVHFATDRLGPGAELLLSALSADGRLVQGSDRIERVETRTVTFSSRTAPEPASARFVGPGPIAIPDSGAATPYPAELAVGGIDGVVSDLRVSLLGLEHSYTGDLDVLLVGPTGQGAILMSDGGGTQSVPLDLTFEDDAPFPAPAPNPLSSGPLRPFDFDGADTDGWPPPAEHGPISPWLGAFTGTDPNGVWRLFIHDDQSGDSGSLGEWRIDFTIAHRYCNDTPVPIPDLGGVWSRIVVPDLGGAQISHVAVLLRGLAHDYPADLDIVLEDQQGYGYVLLSDAGGFDPAAADLLFDYQAEQSVAADALLSGSYLPTDLWGADADSLPGGAPTPPWRPLWYLPAEFPDGNWTLWLADDATSDVGVLEGGWCMIFTTVPIEQLSNPTPIAVPAGAPGVTQGAAAPYPSEIHVAGVAGGIAHTRVTLHGFTHSFPDDVDVLLVGPRGTATLLMSDAGGSGDVSGLTLVFDNLAPGDVPPTSLASGSYRPTDYGGGDADAFPAPAPPGPYLASLLFVSEEPNGIWSLWVQDDGPGDSGQILAGWELELALVHDLLITEVSDVTVPIGPGSGSPYPSELLVTNHPSPVHSLELALYLDEIHSPEDLDIMLEGPNGENAIVMSDAGGSASPVTAFVNIADDADGPVPSSLPINGTYLPTDNAPADSWPAPAPAPSGRIDLRMFEGIDPNGIWKLWVYDDSGGAPALGDLGWSVHFNAAHPVGPVHGLRFEESATRLAWSAAEHATRYGLDRGELPELGELTNPGPEGCDRAVVDHPFFEGLVDVPPPGAAYWYLVRGASAVLEGPAGRMRFADGEHARIHEPGGVCPLAAIDIEKATNGQDADSAPGPSILEGNAVDWSYVVSNVGLQPLSGIVVTDNMGVSVSCPKTALDIAEVMVCTGSGIAQTGQYANWATATGYPPLDPPVTDLDWSHYFGLVTLTSDDEIRNDRRPLT